ncbi:hypothetical protein [Pseudomonas aeruginosa]|uniref:hypothetical protein n=1 Tax=Pseudomonas aeruginosa TaxID=287 RepID=UPI0023DB3C18|nr:hypothetical protein [Pseudomonas aeruginosa]MDF1653239.1 hypothetical protein [Pseudomonas aeruginosa]
MSCKKDLTIVVREGSAVIVHLSSALSDETTYQVQYAIGDSKQVEDKWFAPVYKDAAGAPASQWLVLTPATTPIILRVAGVYRLVKESPEAGLITQAEGSAENVRGV